jgi:hypothetical protein
VRVGGSGGVLINQPSKRKETKKKRGRLRFLFLFAIKNKKRIEVLKLYKYNDKHQTFNFYWTTWTTQTIPNQ